MKTRLEWLDTQFADLDTLVASVHNDDSASPFVRMPDVLAVNGSGERERTVSRMRAANFTVSAHNTEAMTVDVLLNGRLLMHRLAVMGGTCAFRAKVFDSETVPGTRALVAVLGRRADGTIILRDYVTLRAAGASNFGIVLR